jgi:4-hydroxybenzoate polyprenyltransferase
MKAAIRRLTDGIVLADVYAALIGTLIAVLYIADLGGGASPEAVLIIFSEGLIIYALNRQVDREIDAINNPTRTAFLATNRMLVLVPSVALFSVLTTYVFLTNGALFKVVVAIFLISIFYNFSIVPSFIAKRIGFSRLKEAFLLKNASVGLMYGMVAFIPAVATAATLNLAFLAFFAFITIRFFIVSVVFDLRDVEGDAKLGIRTIPIVIGKVRTAKILQWLNAASLVLVLTAFYFSTASRVFLAAACLTVLYGSYYIGETQKKGADLGFICGYMAEADIVPAALAAVIFLVTSLA